MNVAIFAFSKQGCAAAQRAAAYFQGCGLRLFAPKRLEFPGFSPFPSPGRDFYGAQFAWADALVFVGACGIAVREIAPHVRDKRTDPAVVVLDEHAAFVVPLLSGHIGGANALAERLAAFLHATPVITTATDLNGRFSVDAWASRRGYLIDNIKAAKAVSAAILERCVPLCSEFPVLPPLPNGVVLGGSGAVGIYVGVRRAAPFAETLRIIPPVLHLGIGCRRGTSAQAIGAAVSHVLDQHGLDGRAVKRAASIDLKAEEPGLLEFCGEHHWPVEFYSRQELWAVPGSFTSSEFVQATAGVDNVCERAAMAGGERLLVAKTARNGVTVAVAAEKLEVSFE